jgi:hypothetical protein
MNSDLEKTDNVLHIPYDDVPPEIIPKSLGTTWEYVTTAPTYLVNFLRNSLMCYSSVLRLELVPNTFMSTDKSIQQPYIKILLRNILVSPIVQSGAKYKLDFTNKSSVDIVALRMGDFVADVSTGATKAAIEESIHICMLMPKCNVSFEAQVVKVLGFESGVQRILARFSYSNKAVRDLQVIDVPIEGVSVGMMMGVDQIHEQRFELDQPPFDVKCMFQAGVDGMDMMKEIQNTICAILNDLAINLEGNVTMHEGVICVSVPEPCSVVMLALTAYVVQVCDPEGKKYLLFAPVIDTITGKNWIRTVYGGSRSDLITDLKTRIGELRDLFVQVTTF